MILKLLGTDFIALLVILSVLEISKIDTEDPPGWAAPVIVLKLASALSIPILMVAYIWLR